MEEYRIRKRQDQGEKKEENEEDREKMRDEIVFQIISSLCTINICGLEKPREKVTFGEESPLHHPGFFEGSPGFLP
jgi:hypothetical protein